MSRSELEPLPQPVLPGGRGAQRETQRASSVSSTSGHLKASLPLPLEPGGPPKATVPAHAPQLRFHFSPGLPNRLTPVPTQSQQVMSPLAVGQQGPPPGLCPRLASASVAGTWSPVPSALTGGESALPPAGLHPSALPWPTCCPLLRWSPGSSPSPRSPPLPDLPPWPANRLWYLTQSSKQRNPLNHTCLEMLCHPLRPSGFSSHPDGHRY